MTLQVNQFYRVVTQPFGVVLFGRYLTEHGPGRIFDFLVENPVTKSEEVAHVRLPFTFQPVRPIKSWEEIGPPEEVV